MKTIILALLFISLSSMAQQETYSFAIDTNVTERTYDFQTRWNAAYSDDSDTYTGWLHILSTDMHISINRFGSKEPSSN